MKYALAALLLLIQPGASGDDTFRAAALVELRRAAPVVAEKDLSLLASPPVLGPLQRVTIANARYDSAQKRWQLQLLCVPRQSCIPAFAVVDSSDQGLFRATASRVEHPIIHAGDQKPAVLSVGTIRIRQMVICLQPGRVGDTIRVRECHGRRIWLATVASDGSLSMRSRL